MKILIAHDGANAHGKERMGWARCLNYSGHEVVFYDIRGKSAYDQFDEFGKPDLFLGQGYNLSESLINVILENPEIKVWLKLGDFGRIYDGIDLNNYQILMASEQEKKSVSRLIDGGISVYGGAHYWVGRELDTHGLWYEIGVEPLHMTLGADVFQYTNGRVRPEFECDIGIISGFWPYKSQTITKYLFPLMNPESKLNIKVFGYNWPTQYYCGGIEDELERDVLKSQKISINLHEPHALDERLGIELNERTFKCLSNGCFVISDKPKDLSEQIFPNEVVFADDPGHFKHLIHHYLSYPEDRQIYISRGYKKVIDSETYFHRCSYLMDRIFGNIERDKILNSYEKIKRELCLI